MSATMFGVNFAYTNSIAPDNNLFVRLQIKDDGGDEDYLKLSKRTDDELQDAVNYNNHGFSGSLHFPNKDDHERSVLLHDPDYETKLFKIENDGFKSVDVDSKVKPRLTRPGSIMRPDPSIIGDTNLFGDVWNEWKLVDRSVLRLEKNLENSESERRALLHELQQAHNVLWLQSEQLRDVESAVTDNNVLVHDLQFKEMKYRYVLDSFEASSKEKQKLQVDNLRLREDVQERVNALDYQLEIFKEQHRNKGCIIKQNILLNNTAAALSLSEEKNKKLEQDNLVLLNKVQKMTDEMRELHSLLQIARDENQHLSAMWKTSNESKAQAAKLVNEYQGIISDLKSRLSSASADHDRLFAENSEINKKIQQIMLEKEKLMKVNKELDAELTSLKGVYVQAVDQVAALEQSRSEWQLQKDLAEQKYHLQAEVNRLTQDNKQIKLAMENTCSKADYEKLQEAYRKLQGEYNKLKQEYDLLNSKHQQCIISQASHGEVVEKEKQEKILMNKEKNDLLKQLTLLQGQLSQMENSKKQAEEKIFKLTSELQEVNAQLKQNNNKDQSEIQELRKTVKKMEEENQTLLHDVQTIRNLLEAETSQEQLNLKRSQSAQSLQEEMTKTEGSEMYDSYGQNQDALFRKSLELRSTSVPPMLIEPGKSQQKGQYGACFFVLPDKSENEGGGRLQTLISKYRSHSENETADLQLSMKPLSGNVSSNLVSKSRFSNAVPTTNVKNNSRSLPTEAVSEQQERSSMTANQFSKPTKVLPSSNTTMHTSHLPPTKKSSFMSTLSREDDRRETAPVQSGTKLPSSVRRTLPSVISGKTISSAGT